MSSSATKTLGKRYLPLSATSQVLESEVLKDISKHPLSGTQSSEDKHTGSDSSNLHLDHKPHKILSDDDELKLCMSSSSDSSSRQSSSNKRAQRLPYKRCSADRYLIDLVYGTKAGLCERSSQPHDDDSGSHSDSASEPKPVSPRGSEKSSKTLAAPTRVLRSATRGQATHFNEKKKKCHLCRERMEDFKLTRCINFTKCHGAFCTPCLEKHFKAKLKKERVKRTTDQWVCFLCRGLCQCLRCQDDLRSDLIALQCGGEIPDIKECDSSEDKKTVKEGTRTNSTSSPETEPREKLISEKALPDVRHPNSGVCQGVPFAELSYPVFPSYIYPQDSGLYYQSSFLHSVKVPGEVPTHSPQSGS